MSGAQIGGIWTAQAAIAGAWVSGVQIEGGWLMPAGHELITIYAGEGPFPIEVAVLTDDGRPKDLTDVTSITMALYQDIAAPVLWKAIGDGVTMPDDSGEGIFVVTLEVDDLAALTPGVYLEQTLVVDADGVARVVAEGPVLIAQTAPPPPGP